MGVHSGIFTEEEHKTLLRGEVVSVGSKRYRFCTECRQIVCMNKTFFGSLHVCD